MNEKQMCAEVSALDPDDRQFFMVVVDIIAREENGEDYTLQDAAEVAYTTWVTMSRIRDFHNKTHENKVTILDLLTDLYENKTQGDF